MNERNELSSRDGDVKLKWNNNYSRHSSIAKMTSLVVRNLFRYQYSLMSFTQHAPPQYPSTGTITLAQAHKRIARFSSIYARAYTVRVTVSRTHEHTFRSQTHGNIAVSAVFFFFHFISYSLST